MVAKSLHEILAAGANVNLWVLMWLNEKCLSCWFLFFFASLDSKSVNNNNSLFSISRLPWQIHVYRGNKFWLLERWVRRAADIRGHLAEKKQNHQLMFSLPTPQVPTHRTALSPRATTTTPRCQRQATSPRSTLPFRRSSRWWESTFSCAASHPFNCTLMNSTFLNVSFCSTQKHRKIPEGPMPPSTPKYAYGRVAMKRVCSRSLRYELLHWPHPSDRS